MTAKVFEVILHKLPSGKSPASAPEEHLNEFLGKHPNLQVVATHMSTVVAPAEPQPEPEPAPEPAAEPEPAADADATPQVVSLDAFRRRSPPKES